MENIRIKLFLLLFCTIYSTYQAEVNSQGTFTFPQTNVYAKPIGQNVIYAATPTTFIIYRMNYTRNHTFIQGTSYNYTTTHTKKIRTIGISARQTFLASGSEDFSIQIVRIYPKIQMCKLKTFNQLRTVVFHPFYEEILYSATVNDAIRKWNITNCSEIVKKTIQYSVHSMAISPDGTKLAFGTLQGHVGQIDQNLTSFNITLSAHGLTVLYTYYLFPNYYLTVGDDLVAILWKNGTYITNTSSLLNTRMYSCVLNNLYDPNDYNIKFMVCFASSNYVWTYKITTTTIVRFTSHGPAANTPLNWVDARWISPDQQTFTFHYGSAITHDVLFDSGTTCTAIEHLAYDKNTFVCRFCGYMIPNCHFCSDSSTCTTCAVGAYPPSGPTCTRCPQSCADCTSANSCSTCSYGWAMNGNSASCGYIGRTGCFTYGSNGNTCTAAGNGYYIATGNVLRPCSYFNSPCLECTQSSSPSCLTCTTGYYLNGSTCGSCATAMPGCTVCAVSNNCLNCSVAYKLNGTFTQCSNCYGTCLTCSYWYNQCLTCSSSQFRYLSGTNCNCLNGYYDLQSSGNYVCALCSSALTNCYLCDNNTICKQCQTNYYTIISGGKTQCALCSAVCQSCNGTSTNCTVCNDNYNRMLQGSNCICYDGYVSINSSIPCFPCNRLNDGCLTCTNQTYCTECDFGYYMVTTNVSYQLCSLCPYYCPSCSLVNGGTMTVCNPLCSIIILNQVMVCNECPLNSFRTLVSDSCPCNTGYFDDNQTVVCLKCTDLFPNCLTCNNRTKCISCIPGMFPDYAHTLCTNCLITCATCNTYFDNCTSCDPTTNRILSNNKCICKGNAYQLNGICYLCQNAIAYCSSCQNAYSCTGCLSGYTLQSDLKKCIDCQGSMNGCSTCASITNCTSCKNPFTLINQRCRCPLDQFTDNFIWGTCQFYGIPGLRSSLNVELQVHQHQNNTLIVFIRFRAQTLYVINKTVEESISMMINGVTVPINFDYIYNNHVKISTQLTQPLFDPNITVIFDTNVFFDQHLLPLASDSQTVSIRRAYYYTNGQIKSYMSFCTALTYIFLILKWVFFALTIIGQGHLIFPVVVFIQLMPLFLMLNLALPANLSMVLDAMLSFQVKSVVPLLSINSNFVVAFPPLVYDYYGLNDFFIFGKIGDLLTIALVCVLTKFDEGFVRMFPPGRIRRYVYDSLVRRGYSVLVLCILSLQPSLILLTGAYIGFSQWESGQQIFNYCTCVFAFGFYFAYNFNHASNLQGSQLMKNIQNQHCFFGINSQQRAANKTTLFVLVTDFWIIGSVNLVPPMVYFVSCILFLALKVVIHLRPSFYVGKFQFGLRTFSNLFLLTIFVLMMLLYLSEHQINFTLSLVEILGKVVASFICCYLCFQILQKVIFTLKLQTNFLKAKTVQGTNGEVTVFENPNAVNVSNANAAELSRQQQLQGNLSTDTNKMNELLRNTAKDGGFSSLDFRNKHDGKDGNTFNPNVDNESNFSNANSMFGQMLGTHTDLGNRSNMRNYGADNTDEYFRNDSAEQRKGVSSRSKVLNTSKYARNNLQLRYKAQGSLT